MKSNEIRRISRETIADTLLKFSLEFKLKKINEDQNKINIKITRIGLVKMFLSKFIIKQIDNINKININKT